MARHEEKCKHSKELDDAHSKIKTNRDYWLFTELFVKLHKGLDYCNCN